ncbi:alpha/beta-hydrolase, partial [Thozetella sp. PMI_491]
LQTGAVVIGLAASAVEATLVARGSAGCGKSHHIGYNNNGGAGFSLGNRTYTVLVPKDYDPNRAYPLIIDFHGHNGSSDVQYRISQYDKFDTKGKFLAVYPQGVPYPNSKGVPESSWEGPSYADPSVDDLAFTADLVQHIEDNYCIDSKRVYASGKSNGAGFVGTLACSEQGGLFAAFAMSSAALYTDNLGAGTPNRNCTRSRATIPIMEVHGSADGTVPYDGGKGSGGYLPPIPSWLTAWAGRDQ